MSNKGTITSLRPSIDAAILDALKKELFEPNRIWFVVVDENSMYSDKVSLYKVVDSMYIAKYSPRIHFDTQTKIYQSYSVKLGFGYSLIYEILKQ